MSGQADDKESAKGLSRSPVVVAAVLTLFGGLAATALTSLNNQGQLELERQKHEGSVILKTIEMARGDRSVMQANILFLLNSKLIRDPDSTVKKHLEAMAQPDAPRVGGRPSVPP